QKQEYLCRRCNVAGEAVVIGEANSLHLAAQVLLHHAQVNKKCAAAKEDIVLRTQLSETEWMQIKGSEGRPYEGGSI
ncbi:MAG TPA: hypothetical protein VFB79_23240, partial [Candidatus Angelobacter sp.]|nr:hypothetical protein [Candidatus Angelobacter sp.]